MEKFAPLHKIKVLDLTVLLPGPYCTMLLAGLGAQVIKVERPEGGDLMRQMAPEAFHYLNGQKNFLTLDLKHPLGKEVFLKLVASCDVVVEGFRPGVAAKLGVDFASVRKANRSIIYCSLSGYGQDGPYAHLPGHDINYMGVAGLLAISGDPSSGHPEYPYGPQYADLMGAMFGASSIMAALVDRVQDRRAQYLDVSLAESTAMLMMPRYVEFMSRGRPSKQQFMSRGPYGVFETRDHKFLTLGIVEDHFWDNFCRAAELPELSQDPTLRGWDARNRQAGRLRPLLEKVFRERDCQDWLERFVAADVPVAPVNSLDDLARDPQFLARGFFRPSPKSEDAAAGLPRFPLRDTDRRVGASAPETPLGRDTDRWLSDLGMGLDAIDSLREHKVI